MIWISGFWDLDFRILRFGFQDFRSWISGFQQCDFIQIHRKAPEKRRKNMKENKGKIWKRRIKKSTIFITHPPNLLGVCYIKLCFFILLFHAFSCFSFFFFMLFPVFLGLFLLSVGYLVLISGLWDWDISGSSDWDFSVLRLRFQVH